MLLEVITHFISTQVFTRLNHLNMCVSYPATLHLMEEVSKFHTVPIKSWIKKQSYLQVLG